MACGQCWGSVLTLCQWTVICFIVPLSLYLFRFWTNWTPAYCDPYSTNSKCYCSLLNSYTCNDDSNDELETCSSSRNENDNENSFVQFELYLSNQYDRPDRIALTEMHESKTAVNIHDKTNIHFEYLTTYYENIFDINSLQFGSNLMYNIALDEDIMDKIDRLLLFESFSQTEKASGAAGNKYNASSSNTADGHGTGTPVAYTTGVKNEGGQEEGENDSIMMQQLRPRHLRLYLWIAPMVDGIYYPHPIKTLFLDINKRDPRAKTKTEGIDDRDLYDAQLHDIVNILFSNENKNCYKPNSVVMTTLNAGQLLVKPGPLRSQSQTHIHSSSSSSSSQQSDGHSLNDILNKNKNKNKKNKVAEDKIQEIMPIITLAPVGNAPLLVNLLDLGDVNSKTKQRQETPAAAQCGQFMQNVVLTKMYGKNNEDNSDNGDGNANARLTMITNDNGILTVNITFVSMESIVTQMFLDGLWSTQMLRKHFIDFDCNRYFTTLTNYLTDGERLIKYRIVGGIVGICAESHLLLIIILVIEFLLVYCVNIASFNVNGILLLPLIIYQFSDFVLSLFIDSSQFHTNDSYPDYRAINDDNYYMEEYNLGAGGGADNAGGVNGGDAGAAGVAGVAGAVNVANGGNNIDGFEQFDQQDAEEFLQFVQDSLLGSSSIGVKLGAIIGIVIGVLFGFIIPIYVILRIIRYYNSSNDNRETKWIKNINSLSFLGLIIAIACLRSNFGNEFLLARGYNYNLLIFDAMNVYNDYIFVLIFIPQIIINFIQLKYYSLPLKLICLKYLFVFLSNIYALILVHRDIILQTYVMSPNGFMDETFLMEMYDVVTVDMIERPAIWFGFVVLIVLSLQQLFL